MQEKQEQDYLKQRKKLLIKLEEMDVYMLLSLRWAIIDKTASEIPLNQLVTVQQMVEDLAIEIEKIDNLRKQNKREKTWIFP